MDASQHPYFHILYLLITNIIFVKKLVEICWWWIRCVA